jgi:superfamily II DNA or RNA helicase
MERMKFKELAHEYQKNVVNYLIKNPFAGVFLDMGMGKTASVLYAFKWLKQKGLASRMLIIAPKYVALYTWKDELIKWIDLNDLKINIAVGNENKRLDAFNNLSDIVIINRTKCS